MSLGDWIKWHQVWGPHGYSADQRALDRSALSGLVLGNIGRTIIDGRMGVLDNTATKTYHAVFEVPADFDAVRPILANGNTSVYAVAHCTVTALSSAADLNGSSETWTDVTFSGAVGANVPAAATTSRRGYLRGDWARTSSHGKTKLVAVRAEISTAGNIYVMGNGTDNYTNWAARTDGHRFVLRQKAGSYATAASASGFDDTTNRSQSPIIGVEVACRGRVLNLCAVGDSIDSGRGTYLGEGWFVPTATALSQALGIPIFTAQLSWAGQGGSQIRDNVIDLFAAGLKPDLLFTVAGSIYDITASTITAASHIDPMRMTTARTVAEMSAYGVRSVLRTVGPVNPSITNHNHDASDALRVAWDDEVVASYGAGGYAIFDVRSALNGITDADGQVVPGAGLTTDGVHPNNAGNAALTPYAVAAAKKALGIA